MKPKVEVVLAAIRKLCNASVNGSATHEQLSAEVPGDYESEFASLVESGMVVADTFEMFRLP